MPESSLPFFVRYWPLPADNGQPVAFRAGKPIGRATFHLDIGAARHTLTALAPGKAARRPAVALFEPDAYCFAVWLLAAWSIGLTVVLPTDDLPATREALPLPWIGSSNPANVLTTWDAAAPTTDADHAHPGVLLFTSGSTGKPTLVEKGLRQLRAEAGMFERAFGGKLAPDTRFVTSVPHQHMYGLPFFMLWSLTSARPFVVEKLRYPEDLGRLSPADYVFISAPTFLKHLASAPAMPGVRWRMATSAGSPLAPGVAESATAWLRAPLYEIYGSTETGAIACRLGQSPWQTMPGVRLSLEEGSSRLIIHSPLLSEAECNSGFLSGDIARLDERGLELLGRADRLIKIGEKRFSLTQIEQELVRLPEVESACVIPLPHGHEGERIILGAVLVLTPEGRARYESGRKPLFDQHLRKELGKRMDSLALPRRWRYVAAFPCNEMGKITRQELERLFAPTLPHAERLPLPQDGKADGEKVLLQLQVPRNLVWFEGHFPDSPILPGVVQLDWVAHFAHRYFGFDVTATDISGLKFQNMIRPGDAPRLALTLKPGGRLEFIYTLDGKPGSHGVFSPRKRSTG
ncbi:MAG: AMP-binding protein [Azoarcus sp.]|jgi:acyl-coenzyme A synthetase/AMP-(fatty) acid ligase|nr:AMP-binding protein [Azoarcus sp.]